MGILLCKTQASAHERVNKFRAVLRFSSTRAFVIGLHGVRRILSTWRPLCLLKLCAAAPRRPSRRDAPDLVPAPRSCR
eukprot:scaffold110764_cov90-Phaeocystis_antarctica.AAC.1